MLIDAITGRGNMSGSEGCCGCDLGQRDDGRQALTFDQAVDPVVELHDADDAVVDVDVVRRHRQGLHVAHDLLRTLAAARDDVDLGRDGVGSGDHARSTDAGNLTERFLQLR